MSLSHEARRRYGASLYRASAAFASGRPLEEKKLTSSSRPHALAKLRVATFVATPDWDLAVRFAVHLTSNKL